ncbi:MAG: hypothetical protein Q9162_005604 [Coniocarpon cinnabarinum]
MSKVPPQGLHILYEPRSRDGLAPQADIIAVHGLGGHMYKSWTHENTSFWLKACLPDDVPNCRISTFGYDSRIFGSHSVSGIEEFARQLLDATAREVGDTGNPIIFICHSLGGIVVKEALVIAHAEKRRYAELLERFKMIVFLGTPHRGSSIADFASGIAHLSNAGARGILFPVWGLTRHDLIQGLKSHSEELEKLTGSFAIPAERISILAGYENQSHPLLDRPIVSRDSALLGYPRETVIALRGHHGTICRFPNRKDPDYGDIVYNLKREMAFFSRPWETPLPTLTPSEAEYVDCIASEDWDYRTLLEPLHERSWFWVLREPCFSEWYTGQSHLLWITGDAGMGKSTLLAFLTEHLKRERLRQSLEGGQAAVAVYSVFCEAQGPQNCRATDVLRTLMVQMALRDRGVLQRLRSIFSQRRQKSKYSLISVWQVFEIALRAVKSSTIIIILDALDALEHQSRQKLLDRLWTLSSSGTYTKAVNKSLKLAVSSRPAQSNIFWTSANVGNFGIRLQLEAIPQGLKQDIAYSIAETFKQLMTAGRLAAEDSSMFHSVIAARSNGSFLWTRLVLHEIESSTFSSLGRVRRLMNNLPSTLQDVYCRYLSKAD